MPSCAVFGPCTSDRAGSAQARHGQGFALDASTVLGIERLAVAEELERDLVPSL